MRQRMTIAAGLAARSKKATWVLAAALTGSAGAVGVAGALLLNPALFGYGLLPAARFGCLIMAGITFAAGWWAIDDLSA